MKTFSLTLWSIILFRVLAHSQDLEDAALTVDSLHRKFAIEKVHLHLDKPYYAAGQTIWLKAYVVDGSNQPSLLSKILYVDLVNEQKQVVKALKLPMAAGLSSGDIALPDTLTEGNYRLRAYTSWMRNFGEESFFDQSLPIGNSLSNEIITKLNYIDPDVLSAEKQTTVSITISDMAGNILPDTDIDFRVFTADRTIEKGRGKTNNLGNLELSFDAKNDSHSRIRLDFIYKGKELTKYLPFRKNGSDLTLQFFPEGGQLVDSIRSKPCLTLPGGDGLGIPVSGYVVDDSGFRVAEFRTDYAGMGNFMLSPYGRTYTAVVNFQGEEHRISLPEAKQEGFVMALKEQSEDKLVFRVAASGNMPANQELSITAQSASEVLLISRFRLDRNFADVAISKDAMTPGIVQFTLFDDKDIPRAERLVFIHQDDQLKLQVSTNRKEYSRREKVKLELKAERNDKLPVSGSFSISVTDMTRVPVNEEDEHSILSDFLIKSELRGYIETPNYYFLDTSGSRKQQLDNLLLCQGWRRVSLKEVIHQAHLPDLDFKVEKNLAIGGTVLLRGNPVPGAKINLLNLSNEVYLDTLADKDGWFNFDNLIFRDSTEFVIQARQEKDRPNVKISLDIPPHQTVSYNPPSAEIRENVNSDMLPYLRDTKAELLEMINLGFLERTNVLEEVVVRAVRDRNYVENSTRLGTAPADFVIRMDQLEGHTNLGVALMNKVPGMIVDVKSMNISSAYLVRSMQTGASAMRLFVDGMDMGTNLSLAPVNDIATVEIIRNSAKGAIYGNAGVNGVIVVTTKGHAGLPANVMEDPEGIITYKVKGYDIAREFYSPDYDLPDTRKNITDQRTTVYWNPDLFVSDGNLPAMEFFTADHAGTYRIVAEGLDADGRLARTVYLFSVKDRR